MKHWKWELDNTGEDLQYTTTEVGDNGHPICPNCGRETHYHYGMVDQDFMGNDLYGEWYACYECEIGTPIEYD